MCTYDSVDTGTGKKISKNHQSPISKVFAVWVWSICAHLSQIQVGDRGQAAPDPSLTSKASDDFSHVVKIKGGEVVSEVWGLSAPLESRNVTNAGSE